MTNAKTAVKEADRMYPELTGKVSLVTGASRGFGRAIAGRLAGEGADVVVNYRRSMSEAREAAREIEQRFGVRAISARADVGSEKSLDEMFRLIEEEFGRLDIVVANAAYGVPGRLIDTDMRRFNLTMEASGRSLLSLARRAVGFMQGWGRIVSITSEGGGTVLPGYGPVGPAKAALESITRYLAAELAGRGIAVNGVKAGPCPTRSLSAIPGADRLLEESRRRAPTGRLIEETDVANAVAFLCSDQARMICGQFITVDGGCSIVR